MLYVVLVVSFYRLLGQPPPSPVNAHKKGLPRGQPRDEPLQPRPLDVLPWGYDKGFLGVVLLVACNQPRTR